MTPTLSVITDEIAPRLDDVLTFAARERLEALEVRQIDGTNFLALHDAEMKQAAERIAAAGLRVSALTTPLLKWPAPGQPFELRGDQFGFDPRGKPVAAHFERACDAAHVFGTRYLRIFSYLSHVGFAQSELDEDLSALIRLAEQHDLVLLMENEPVCNIRDIAGLVRLMRTYDHPRLRCLLDIGNVYGAGGTVSVADLDAIMPYVPYMHIKDYHSGERRHAILGQGSVPYGALLPACLPRAQGEMTLSLEVHVPGGAKPSLDALRRLVAGAQAAN